MPPFAPPEGSKAVKIWRNKMKRDERGEGSEILYLSSKTNKKDTGYVAVSYIFLCEMLPCDSFIDRNIGFREMLTVVFNALP